MLTSQLGRVSLRRIAQGWEFAKITLFAIDLFLQ